MKNLAIKILLILGWVSSAWDSARSQATILPPGLSCWEGTTGINGMIGVLGTVTGGSSYTNGTYGGVALTGGSGTGATANIVVSGNAVTTVAVLNPGTQYVVGDVLSASAATIGGTGSGFSVTILSTAINSALAGGSVSYYVPSTTTFKQTWQNAGQTVLNTNPVILDSNGCALVYGAGIYRQVVKDRLGNTLQDALTASTNSGGSGIFWAGTAGGTGNAITITDSAFAMQDGTAIQFLASATNTGAVTISVSGGPPIPIVQDTSLGPAALTAGQIATGNTPLIVYDATGFQFHLINPSVSAVSTTSASLVPPQGYLNLIGQASGGVVQTGDVIAASTLYYSPYVGNLVPIWDGSTFRLTVISELTATLTAAGSPSGTIQDVCVFSNNGTPTLAIGPSWTTVTAGAGARGTGAGTAQIIKLQGIWTNANAITAYNGLTSYSIPTNRCTVIGSIAVDTAAGQVTNTLTVGQSRKWATWNFYNRQQIVLQMSDPTASWTYGTTTKRQCRAQAANTLMLFSGLAEEPYQLSMNQIIEPTSTTDTQGFIGIGFNSTTVNSGTSGTAHSNANIAVINNAIANYSPPPSIGNNAVNCMEWGINANTTTYRGTEAFMIMTGRWRG